MKISIDQGAGYCPGVVKAIQKAEERLKSGEKLSTLGQIVHNEQEVERLESLGMKTIESLDNKLDAKQTVLLRAHGEPPSTYASLDQHGIKHIDATCPIVLRLQVKVKKASILMKDVGGSVIIYGKPGHPEVRGLLGNIEGNGIAAREIDDIGDEILMRPIQLFSQTTMDPEAYSRFYEELRSRAYALGNESISLHQTICGFVNNRKTSLKEFARDVDVLLFFSGKNSSNGKYLYSVAAAENKNTYLIHSLEDLNYELISGYQHIGISGATSTPQWLMEKAAEKIRNWKI